MKAFDVEASMERSKDKFKEDWVKMENRLVSAAAAVGIDPGDLERTLLLCKEICGAAYQGGWQGAIQDIATNVGAVSVSDSPQGTMEEEFERQWEDNASVLMGRIGDKSATLSGERFRLMLCAMFKIGWLAASRDKVRSLGGAEVVDAIEKIDDLGQSAFEKYVGEIAIPPYVSIAAPDLKDLMRPVFAAGWEAAEARKELK